jgi:hypothetical protein
MPIGRSALAGALVLVLACGGDGPLAPQVQPDPALFGLGGGLVHCAPMAGHEATGVFGPEGGALQVGPHVLAIPAGALNQPVTITAVAPTGPVNRIDFGPEGLVFAEPASLTMSHANCGFLAGLLPKKVAHVDSGPGLLVDVLELLPSTDDLAARRVTGSLTHFSSYAIAW